MSAVKLLFHPYMRGAPEWHDVEATIRGDLAIHRYAMLQESGLSFSKTWTVSHIPTGQQIRQAMPPRFFDRGGCIARKRDLVAWAEAFQAAAPEFFAAVRLEDMEAAKALVDSARDKGRAL